MSCKPSPRAEAAASLRIDRSAVAGRALCIAFSGGLDSSVLLHLLAHDVALRASGLRALHVHHGLHPQADAWAAHCARACAEWDVALTIVRVQVDAGSGLGPEGAARAARRKAFAQALADGEVLALAQHRDDQAETFLLRALRGSGVDGLAAMRPWQAFARGWSWRPLLEVPQARLRDHAQRHDLRWIEDPSNADVALDRNFLRHRVLPLLRERWPQADAAFARSACLAEAAATLLQADDRNALAAVLDEDAASLRIEALCALPAERRARVLRLWVAARGLPPLPGNGVDRIEAELLSARDDAEARFAWHGAWVRRWRGRLHAGSELPCLPDDWQACWDGRDPLALPGGGVLALVDAEAFDEAVQVRLRRGGERIGLPGRRHRHGLKHLLQAAGVPPWLRSRMPLLVADDGELLAAGDALVSARLQGWLDARGARLRWTPC